MTEIIISLPGSTEQQPLQATYEVAEEHITEEDESSFVRADAILDFAQAWNLAQAWARCQTDDSGNLYAATTTGGDDATSIMFAYSDGDAISFSEWFEHDGEHDQYALSSFPLDSLEWTTPPPTVQEWFEQWGPSYLLGIITTFLATAEGIDRDDRYAFVKLVIAASNDPDVIGSAAPLPPDGYDAFITHLLAPVAS